MMAFLAGRSSGSIVARFTPTDRNAPARQFLDSIGVADAGTYTHNATYSFSAASLRGLRWKPAAASASAATANGTEAAPAKLRPPEYVRIARSQGLQLISNSLLYVLTNDCSSFLGGVYRMSGRLRRVCALTVSLLPEQTRSRCNLYSPSPREGYVFAPGAAPQRQGSPERA